MIDPNWGRRLQEINQLAGRMPNAKVQKIAPGRNRRRSFLSVGPDAKIPTASAMHAPVRMVATTSIAQCGRRRVNKASRLRPTNHQPGNAKNGIVIVCQVSTDNSEGFRRRAATASTDTGAPTRTPGKLRLEMRGNRCLHTMSRQKANRRSFGNRTSTRPF